MRRPSFAFWFVIVFVPVVAGLIAVVLLVPELMDRYVPPVPVAFGVVGVGILGVVGMIVEAVLRWWAGQPMSRTATAVRIVVVFVVMHYSVQVGQIGRALWDVDWAALAQLKGVRLERGEDGRFHPFLLINGQRVAFVVDSRRPNTVMSRADATLAGIDLQSLIFAQRIQMGATTHRAARIYLPPLEFVGRIVTGLDAYIPADDGPASVLGADFLDQMGKWQETEAALIIAMREDLPFTD